MLISDVYCTLYLRTLLPVRILFNNLYNIRVANIFWKVHTCPVSRSRPCLPVAMCLVLGAALNLGLSHLKATWD